MKNRIEKLRKKRANSIGLVLKAIASLLICFVLAFFSYHEQGNWCFYLSITFLALSAYFLAMFIEFIDKASDEQH